MDVIRSRSVIENSELLAPSELLFVLACYNIGANGVLLDSTWTKWTGKHARIKEMAIKGLKKKGLEVKGIGEKARYRFDRDGWENWARCQPRGNRAHTAGTEDRKRSVPAADGQMIHPECRATGCAKLCETPCEPQRVVSIESVGNKEIAQSVAQSPPPWELTLGAIRRYFPHVDMAESAFVPQLIRACRGVKDFTDAQLAKAVYAAKTPRQHSEGMFLVTVPNHLAAIVARPTQQQPQSSGVDVRTRLTEIVSAVKKQGMPDIAERIHLLDPDGEPIGLFDALDQIERDILSRLRTRTPIEVFRAEIDKETKPHRAKMSKDQLARLEAQFIDRKLMEAAGIPRLTVL